MPSHSKIEYFLLRCTKIVICVIPILPLYISSSVMFPFITGKNFAFRILVELAAAFWLGLIVANKEYRLRNSPMVLSILIFTFIVGLADLFGINPYKSFWSNYERMEGYITVLHLALYFMIIKSIFRTEKDWKIFFSIVVIVSALVSLYVFIEPLSYKKSLDYLREYGIRSASTIGNPPFLASYLMMAIFIGLILILNTKNTYIKMLYLSAIILNCIVIYITASRGVIIAAVLGAVVINTSVFLRKIGGLNKKRFKKIAVPLIFGLLIISSVIVLAYLNADSIRNDKTISRFAMMFNSDSSIETRLYTWKMAWNGIKENPVLGWGQENYIGIYAVNHISNLDRLVWVDRAHNIIIDWLINAGILGLFSYLAIYLTALYILWNNFQKKIISKNETLIIVTMIFVYLIQNLFTFDTISSYLIFFSLLAYIDSIASVRKVPSLNLNVNIIPNTKFKAVSVTLVLLLVFAFINYYINYIPLKQLQAYSKVSMSLSRGNLFPKLLDDFNEALSYRSFGDNDIRDQMTSVSQQIIKNELYRQNGASRFIEKTLDEIEKGIATELHDLEYMYRVYGFYELLASYDVSFIPKAEALIEKMLFINPNFERIGMSKVSLYFLKKEYETAYVNLKQIIEKYPNNAGSQFKLALAAILTSRSDEVEKALNNVKKLRFNNKITHEGKPIFSIKALNMLAKAYMEVKEYHNALKYYHEIIYILSSDRDIRLRKDDTQPLKDTDKMNMKAQLHTKIAQIYLLLGDTEKAEKEKYKATIIGQDK